MFNLKTATAARDKLLLFGFVECVVFCTKLCTPTLATPTTLSKTKQTPSSSIQQQRFSYYKKVIFLLVFNGLSFYLFQQ